MSGRMVTAVILALIVGALTPGSPAELPALQQVAPSFDLGEATIADLQRRMTAGQDTARSLVEKYLARIEALDRQGPALHSIIEANPDALAVADALDTERRTRGVRGPLHGVPIVIKDNVATGDRMQTTAGSLALAGRPAPKDAFIVARLREAGVVVLGKTNLAEWANARSMHSTNGWSARGGQTRNPYALDRSPAGSSAGSGAAVAANLAAAAVGTETDGSIVAPSSYMSLVGIKPTVGLVSRTGIVPIAHSQDTAGPMARSVADAALLLGAMVGSDLEDPATADSTRRGLRDYSASLDARGLEGARIGIVRRKLFGYSRAADELAETAIADMKRHGAEIVDPADIPTLGQFDDTELEVLLYEFKADLQKYLAWLGPAAPIHSLRDVIAFNAAHRDQELGLFGQELMIRAEAKGPLTSVEYRRALARNHRLSRALGIDSVMTRYTLDALVAPTFGPPIMLDMLTGDHYSPDEVSPATVAAVAGYPHVTVPMGLYRGLPIGISFFGRAWSEPTLIRIAFAYEQATRHRRPPTFAATADPSAR